MQKMLSSTLATLAFLVLSAQAIAGDCAKTVMGGGCSAEVEQGVSSHMRGSAVKEKAAAKVAAPAPTEKSKKVSVASK